MSQRNLFLVIVTVVFGLVACAQKEAGTPEAKTATAKPAAKAEAKPEPKAAPAPAKKQGAEGEALQSEVVFDPRKPPAGYAKCHRNHCHRVGGGVASYKQVMAEIGATKIVGVPSIHVVSVVPHCSYSIK